MTSERVQMEMKLALLLQVERCALISARMADSCLNVADLASDRTLHDALIVRAERALRKIDRLLGTFDFEARQLATIQRGRNWLATRLQLGNPIRFD